MHTHAEKTPYYGLMAEFAGPAELVAAAEKAYANGYRKMDAYTPLPVEGLAEALGFRNTKLPWIVLAGGLAGGLGGFFMQYFANVIHYPWNIGGRPLNSWPAFMPVSFECTVLLSAFCAVFGMLALNGLPMPYHPVFNAPRFDRASQDGFFLCIESVDTKFDLEKTKQFLESLKPMSVAQVEH